MELLAGIAIGAGLTILAFVLFPKVSDIAGNIHRSRALAKAQALVASAEANAAQLAAAKQAIAAAAATAKAVLPTPPPNPLAPTGATGA